jgi:hypothetical protein
LPAVPSIKATGFQSAADDLAKLLASQKLTRAELEKRLHSGDLQYLGKQLAASSWVPIATYARALDVLIALEGGSDVDAYLRGRGKRAAARLHKMGLYGQFEATVETWGAKVGTITATMGAVLYNFTKWSFESDPDTGSFETTLAEARDYPEALRAVGEGFIQYLAEHLMPDRKVEVTSEDGANSAASIVFRGRSAGHGADVPSIKATASNPPAATSRLLSEGRLSRADFEARLPAGDRAYLEKKLAASSWVPIATYVRVAAILAELEGRGDARAYFRARGYRAAERLHKAGVYRQFEASVETWGKRAGSIATTMSAVLYNFTRWTFEARPERGGFEIRIDGARELPDSLRFVGEGFIEYISRHQSAARRSRCRASAPRPTGSSTRSTSRTS